MMKVPLHTGTTEGSQLILNNTFRALILIVLGATLQAIQENLAHHLIVTLYLFLIFHLFMPKGKKIFLKNRTLASW